MASLTASLTEGWFAARRMCIALVHPVRSCAARAAPFEQCYQCVSARVCYISLVRVTKRGSLTLRACVWESGEATVSVQEISMSIFIWPRHRILFLIFVRGHVRMCARIVHDVTSVTRRGAQFLKSVAHNGLGQRQVRRCTLPFHTHDERRSWLLDVACGRLCMGHPRMGTWGDIFS